MLTINKNILAKDFKGEINVDGINMYNPDTLQFSLYKLISADEEIYDELNINKNSLLVFPFQCGIKFASGYHILNIRDCLAVTTLEELSKAWKGEL